VLSRPDVKQRESVQIWAALEQHWLTVIAQWQKS
jgi:ribonuclease P protein component